MIKLLTYNQQLKNKIKSYYKKNLFQIKFKSLYQMIKSLKSFFKKI